MDNIWLKNNKLIEMVKEHAVQYGDFVLSSGQKSNYFVDMSQVTNRSDCLDLICDSILRHVKSLNLNIDSVGGPALGAAPLIGGMLLSKNRDSYGQSMLRGFLVRKEGKKFANEYMTPNSFIEGNLSFEDKVVMVEDVVTTGNQLKKACDLVQNYPAEIVSIVSILDRSNGEAKSLLGDKYHCMMTIEDLGIHIRG